MTSPRADAWPYPSPPGDPFPHTLPETLSGPNVTSLLHPPSGLRFPRRQGPFVWHATYRYDVSGENVSLRYLGRPGQWLSVYIFPSMMTSGGLDESFAISESDVRAAHLGHVVVERRRIGVLDASQRYWEGRRLVLRGEGGEEPVPRHYRAFLELFELRGWTLKVRATCPDAQADGFERALAAFFGGVLADAIAARVRTMAPRAPRAAASPETGPLRGDAPGPGPAAERPRGRPRSTR